MQTMLIDPEGLEADAVVPQCLDNQYVPDSLFSKMMSESLDFTDREIARLRENNFRTEFIRSLIYSSQVVIQRAFLKNSEFLYKNFLPEDNRNFHAFGQLIRDKAVVPFLFTESSLHDDHGFDVHKEGDRAAKALLDQLDEVTCVRLAVPEQANKKACDGMATTFGTGLVRLSFLNDEQRSAMAGEVFLDRSRLEEPGLWQAFNAAIDRLAHYSFTRNAELRGSGKLLQRQDVYRDNFVVDRKDSVVRGQFRRPDRDSPFLLELKKYVDLIYNVNLPDHLRRYTFTPEKMPSRMALQDAPGKGFSHKEVSATLADSDALESIRRTFMAHSQKAMSLPLLRDLTVADVREIRALPQWRRFTDAQSGILQDPLHCLARLEQFQSNFDEFQHALSDWYNRTYRRVQTEEKYCSYVSLALSLGGKLIVAGSDLGKIEKILGMIGVEAIGHIPEKIKHYAAKLMVNVYDLGAKRLDTDRSYSIELMQASADLVREDVIELLGSINRQSKDALPAASEQFADQGIQ
jgi:hypothetical protein